MKLYSEIKPLTSAILVVSLLLSSFSALIVEASESSYTLVDSEVLDDNGDWVNTGRTYNSHFDDYNCYAYAIGRVDSKFYNLNDLIESEIQYQPGDIFTNVPNAYTRGSNNIDLFRCTVIKDLLAIGYTNIEASYNVMPTIGENQELICLRMGYFLNSDGSLGVPDYHFMKYDYNTQAWYHKPGTSAILKYVSEDGILPDGSLATNVIWTGEGVYEGGDARDREKAQRVEYSGDIVYIAYDKHQIIVSDNGTSNEEIIIQGGSDFYCCTNGVCCCGRENCGCGIIVEGVSGLCCCGNSDCNNANNSNNSPYPGKDVIYEIVVPESGCYTIEIETPIVSYNSGSAIANFNYEIYSYNMYNGDYIVTSGRGQSGSTFSETVNLIAYHDYNDGTTDWQYRAYKHYIRLDFERMNKSDVSVDVSITHTHEYTDHFESYSSTQHTSYCWCGVYELQNHSLGNGLCILCGAPHIHDYSDRYVPKTNSTHISYCGCGSTSIQPHVVSAGAFSSGNKYAICLACGGTATTGVVLHQAVWNLPRSENGSFILPNGVIVLVDEDIEAYFDGRLEFIYPDDNLETE